jgi:hypothetical protein
MRASNKKKHANDDCDRCVRERKRLALSLRTIGIEDG